MMRESLISRRTSGSSSRDVVTLDINFVELAVRRDLNQFASGNAEEGPGVLRKKVPEISENCSRVQVCASKFECNGLKTPDIVQSVF